MPEQQHKQMSELDKKIAAENARDEAVMKPLNFSVVGDFTVKLSTHDDLIKVPRLKFKEAKDVIRIIGEVLAKDTGKVLEILGMEIQRKSMDGDKYIKHGKMIEAVVKGLINLKNYELVEDLLTKLSAGKITKDMIQELQYGEAVTAVSYLVDMNFAPLKNLDASLQAVTMSQSKTGM